MTQTLVTQLTNSKFNANSIESTAADYDGKMGHVYKLATELIDECKELLEQMMSDISHLQAPNTKTQNAIRPKKESTLKN